VHVGHIHTSFSRHFEHIYRNTSYFSATKISKTIPSTGQPGVARSRPPPDTPHARSLSLISLPARLLPSPLVRLCARSRSPRLLLPATRPRLHPAHLAPHGLGSRQGPWPLASPPPTSLLTLTVAARQSVEAAVLQRSASQSRSAPLFDKKDWPCCLMQSRRQAD